MKGNAPSGIKLHYRNSRFDAVLIGIPASFINNDYTSMTFDLTTDLLSFLDRPKLFITCTVAAIPAYIAVGSVFYDSWEDFIDGLRLWFQPGWLSFLRGEWSEDNWQTLKLLFYLLICAALATTAYKAAQHFF